MSQCGSINVCSLCVCVCGIDFYFHFLSGINKMYLKSLYSSASQETYYTLSSVCEVTVVDVVPYARAAFYKSYTTVVHGRMKVAGGQGRREKKQFWILVSAPHVFCRTCKLEVESCSKGASGSKQTTSLKFHAFAEDLVVFLKFPPSRAKERGRGKRV